MAEPQQFDLSSGLVPNQNGAPAATPPQGSPDIDLSAGLVPSAQTDSSTPVATEPTLREQLRANTEPLPTDTGHPLTNLSNFGQDVLRRGARVIGTGLLDTF